MADDIPKIRKLDTTVVNRIAAGEVVQRPSSAIKELVENSLDAGATSIVVTIKQGGLQLMQIQDNGHGIRKDDLDIVCERFTTSKLSSFEDLKQISTYGFRGEALASITHVAHVNILTRTKDSPCAYKARYCDGKLIGASGVANSKGEVKACAGVLGTTITVEDLFYNMPTRKQAFKNANEEYQRVLDVITKYAIRFGDDKIAFTCKKQGQMVPDLHTANNSSTLDNIRIAYGPQVARELIDFHMEYKHSSTGASDESGFGSLQFSVQGKVSNANYSNKKPTYILFINNRLVESNSIRKVVESVYQEVLPKHAHPFVYLSISMPSHHVDVNVHPTKREVHFLYEDLFLEKIYNKLADTLRHANDSRSFQVQRLVSTATNNNITSSSAVLTSSFLGNDHDDADEFAANVHTNSAISQQQIFNPLQDSPVVTSSRRSGTDPVDQISPDDRSFLLSNEGLSQSQPQNIFSSKTNAMGTDDDDDDDDDDDNDEAEEEVLFRQGKVSPFPLSSSGKIFHNDKSSSSFSVKRKASDAWVMNSSSSSGGMGGMKVAKTASTTSIAPNKLIRTDHRIQKIDTFFRPSMSAPVTSKRDEDDKSNDVQADFSSDLLFCMTCLDDNESMNKMADNQKYTALPSQCACCGDVVRNDDEDDEELFDESAVIAKPTSIGKALNESQVFPTQGTSSIPRPVLLDLNLSTCEYTSIHTLTQRIHQQKDSAIERVLKQYTFVGVVNCDFSLIQFQTKLLLVDHSMFLMHLFYQLCVFRFGEMDFLKLASPLHIEQLVRSELQASLEDKSTILFNPSIDGDMDQVCAKIIEILLGKAELLEEYFRISINDKGYITTLPALIPIQGNSQYYPDIEWLGHFLILLALETDWDDELKCFQQVSLHIADFYAKLPIEEEHVESSTSNLPLLKEEAKFQMEDLLYPAMKKYLVPSRSVPMASTVIELASLEQMYKIFERC